MILIFLHEVTFASRVEIDLIDFFLRGRAGEVGVGRVLGTNEEEKAEGEIYFGF